MSWRSPGVCWTRPCMYPAIAAEATEINQSINQSIIGVSGLSGTAIARFTGGV